MQNKSSRIIVAFVGASFAYFLISVSESLITNPLRQTSSFLAYSMTSLFLQGVELNGTIISTDVLTFDVVPACSGSAVLKNTLFFGIVTFFIFKQFQLKQFSLFVIALLGIALISNSLRISSLVIIGTALGFPVEGLIHDFVGITTFLISILLSILMLLRFKDIEQNQSSKSKSIISIFIYMLILFPFLKSTLFAWLDSPLDQFSSIFFVVGCIGLYDKFKTTNIEPHKFGLYSLKLSHFLLVLAALMDYNFIWAFALVLLISSYVIRFRGINQFKAFIPSLIIVSLSFPVSSYLINSITSAYFSTALIGVLAMKSILCFLCIIFHFKKVSCARTVTTQKRVNTPSPAFAFAVILICPFFIMSDTLENGTNPPSYLVGSWVGHHEKLNPFLANFFKKEDVYYRQYNSERFSNSLRFMLTRHKGERHKMHNPEYCLLGSKWIIVKSEDVLIENIVIRAVSFRRNHEKKFCYYWYSNYDETFTSMSDVVKNDIWQRLSGQISNWELTRVVGDDSESIENFLREYLIKHQINKKEKSHE